MTAAIAYTSTSGTRRVRPAGINRIALTLGMALVTWSRRPAGTHTPLTHDELLIRRTAEREGHQLRADYAASKMLHGLIR